MLEKQKDKSKTTTIMYTYQIMETQARALFGLDFRLAVSGLPAGCLAHALWPWEGAEVAGVVMLGCGVRTDYTCNR